MIASIGTGAIGGWICGFIILSFGFLIGRSGDRGIGQEEFGYWNPMVTFGLAGFYGMPIGAIMFPIGYLAFFQRASLYEMLVFATTGTLLGGLCGALIGPPTAVLSGILGFFIAAVVCSAKGKRN